MKPSNLPEKIVWSKLDAEQRASLLEWARVECADLSGDYLSRANLSWANLSWANLSGADLSRANLSGADLSRANLSWANLSGANLSGANLSGADLSRANLSWANLSGANLSGADLSGAENAEWAFALTKLLPDGDLIGWKKLRYGKIAKLRIPSGAKRSNATGRKCRAEFAEVLEIWDGDKPAEIGISMYDDMFRYEVGKTVTPKEPFDENRWYECASGIHFFITRIEAEKWQA